jgi:hypothetical protein
MVALTDSEMNTLREIAATVPRALRGEFLQRFARLLAPALAKQLRPKVLAICQGAHLCYGCGSLERGLCQT